MVRLISCSFGQLSLNGPAGYRLSRPLQTRPAPRGPGWANSVPAVALPGCPLGTGTENYTPLHHIGLQISVYRFLIFLRALFIFYRRVPQLRAKEGSDELLPRSLRD
jgi:hypothetical protein